MEHSPVIFWFRRDLRLHDNHGLYAALSSGHRVIPIFIFDTNILSLLPTYDRRIDYIHQHVQELSNELQKVGSELQVYAGNPVEIFSHLIQTMHFHALFYNEDYEPYAIERDTAISSLCKLHNIKHHAHTDHVIFHPNTVLKDKQKPYTVFTPYSKKWKQAYSISNIPNFPSETLLRNCMPLPPQGIPSIESLGHQKTNITIPNKTISPSLLEHYHITRDEIYNSQGTSHMSVHLRFGTVSVRELFQSAWNVNETFCNELIWREFFIMILWHFPETEHQSFQTKFQHLPWDNNETYINAWKTGKTGYPLVDAGIRELLETGYMHNRVRMLTASFLCKHLLTDWKIGERFFAEKLNDFELASNIGGWQWAAGTGCDAAPYFRVFNPYTQQKKFDPAWEYIKKWVPEIHSLHYPQPIVDHNTARKQALAFYSSSTKK